jgi:hypothetical protein
LGLTEDDAEHAGWCRGFRGRRRLWRGGRANRSPAGTTEGRR